MRLLLLAPPGAGKGTQGVALADHFGVAHISSGDLLRAELRHGTRLGRRAQRFLDAGDLVPDEVMRELLLDTIDAAARAGGYILDGFPRTVAQSEAAAAVAERRGIGLEAVVHLRVPDDVLVARLLARARGADDSEETIRHRLEVYGRETAPLVARYRERGLLHDVDGDQPPPDVTDAIVKALG
ncbi:MAG TPA: adenylate kinase [Mycobacteriales bacterium]